MNWRNTILLTVLGAGLCISAGCFTAGKKPAQQAIDVPPGLDAQTVARANQVAENNFVPVRQEKEAERQARSGKENLDRVDEFWKYLEQTVQKQALSSSEQAQFERELNQGAQALTKWKQMTGNGKDEKAFAAALRQCQKAQEHLENAVRLNPFDKNARALLAVCYYNLQNYFGLEKNYEKSVEVLERLVRIERGEHELYRLLGENYLALEKYEQAVKNFNLGKTVLIKTSFDGPPPAEKLYYYAYMLGDTYARMYNATTAMNMFKAALQFAKSEQEKTDVENYMKWINWDGGNIRASERWDEILQLESRQEYKRMAAVCEKLLPTLQTTEAKLAVHQKLAVVEFEYLDRKPQAVERMKSVFERIPPEKRENPDERTRPILNTYGAMLYRLGVEARNQEERKVALAYFTKAVSFKWDQMAKAMMEMVTLVWNTPEQAVRFGELALQNGDGVLTEDEKCELLSLLVKANKSAGQFDKARTYFETWKKCQEKT